MHEFLISETTEDFVKIFYSCLLEKNGFVPIDNIDFFILHCNFPQDGGIVCLIQSAPAFLVWNAATELEEWTLLLNFTCQIHNTSIGQVAVTEKEWLWCYWECMSIRTVKVAESFITWIRIGWVHLSGFIIQYTTALSTNHLPPFGISSPEILYVHTVEWEATQIPP